MSDWIHTAQPAIVGANAVQPTVLLQVQPVLPSKTPAPRFGGRGLTTTEPHAIPR